jgi:type I restriction enzyme R subunit
MTQSQSPQVGQIERDTQDRVIRFFQDNLGYDYLGNWEKRQNNSNIEEEYVRKYLQKQNYSEILINKAIAELKKIATNQQKQLYDINQEIYSKLRFGVNVDASPSEHNETVQLIDWKNPENNHFAVAEEVTITGKNNKRPDIVIYVNGIALGVLELKRSKISISEGISQNLDNQKKEFIWQFFTTQQLIMAGNDTQGLRYGVIQTPEKYYMEWKENISSETFAGIENILDRYLFLVLNKKRFLELIHDFIVFDKGYKKIARHNQYHAVKAAQQSLKQREGGIIWHSQGSGKSLIMVWLAQWIKENIDDSRVLIITDRIELDEQIEKVYKAADEKDIYKTTSGKDLLEKLNSKEKPLICSLVHKFGRMQNDNIKKNGEVGNEYDDYLREIRQNMPKDFIAKGDIYVFVDECHRTQSGKLHNAMKEILPEAVFIGFTGTPLLKKDKITTLEIFGKYIHTYKFDQAVNDGVVLDLRYEARDIEQKITSQDKIDLWFEAKTKGLTDIAKTQLKKRWGTMQKVLNSKSRFEKIVNDIILDFGTIPRLTENGYGNAMLVAENIYAACRYYELFMDGGFEKCAVVTSYNPLICSIKGAATGGDEISEDIVKNKVYRKMLASWFNLPEDEAVKKNEQFEREVKKKFIDEPGQMKLLIVVDKLLTGFDAPSATYLYIDKRMQDQGLFQAICRVNRLDKEDKEFGYIVDYKDLFKKIEKAVEDYTSEAFSGFDDTDIKGLLKDRLKEAKKRLDDLLDQAKALTEGAEAPKDSDFNSYRKFFIGENPKEKERLRLKFYQLVALLIRAYADIANEMPEAGYSQDDINRIKKDVKFFVDLRDEIKLASADAIDLKAYEPSMRYMIDAYINAESSVKLSAFDNFTLLQLVNKKGLNAVIESLPESISKNKEALAETIENNVRKLITEERPVNPIYYDKMSKILDELVKKRKEDAIEYQEYLKKIEEIIKTEALQKNTGEDKSKNYPSSLKTKALKALYDNLDENEELVLKLDENIRKEKKDDWRGNTLKEREVYNVIGKCIEKYIKAHGDTTHINGIVKDAGTIHLTVNEEKPEYNANHVINSVDNISIDEKVQKIFTIVKNQNEY